MCEYCNPMSAECEYWIDPLDHKWYLEVRTGEWDEYNDDYVYERIYGVKYCQYCGSELND